MHINGFFLINQPHFTLGDAIVWLFTNQLAFSVGVLLGILVYSVIYFGLMNIKVRTYTEAFLYMLGFSFCGATIWTAFGRKSFQFGVLLFFTCLIVSTLLLILDYYRGAQNKARKE